ncbi:MAG: hypothetical protein Q9221_005369 [Calogaya cf. arnoldii]
MVLPIFYEGLLRSRKLFLSYNDLDYFPRNQTQLYQYYSQKLEKLSLRLHGQPSRHISLQPFFDNSFEDFSDDSELDSAADTDSDSASHASSADDLVDGMVNPVDSAKYRRHVLSTWKDDLAGHLHVFSDFVAKCESLHELTFQAYYGFEELSLSQWNYLDCGAMDVHYSSRGRGRHNSRRNPQRQQVHFAKIQNDDQVPSDSINQQQLQFVMYNSSRTVGTSRLKSLVLRLWLPHSPADTMSDDPGPCNVQQCRSFQDVRPFGLPRMMALAARHILGLEPGIGSLKISFKMPSLDNFSLCAFDCVPWTLITMDQGINCYEDDGSVWEDWENNTDVVSTDIPTPAELSSMAYDVRVLRPAGSTADSDDEWEHEPDIPEVAQVDTDDEWTDESEEDDGDGFNDPWADESDGEEDIYGMGAFADLMYPGAAAAGLGIGDIMDLMEHDMIFGSDHTPF